MLVMPKIHSPTNPIKMKTNAALDFRVVRKNIKSSLGQWDVIRAYTVRGRQVVTKSEAKGWREKLAQWVGGAMDWLSDIAPVAPEPVPVRVRPRPVQPPPRR